MTTYYDLRFRATYHGMRVLIEACEKAEGDGIEFVEAKPETAPTPPPQLGRPSRVKSGPSRSPGLNGKTGKDTMRELLAAKGQVRVIKLSEAQEFFRANGFNPSTASAIMSWAIQQKMVERIGEGVYRRLDEVA